MTAITDFLFPAPAPRHTLGIVRWWESRRLAFNLMVGGAGLFSLATIEVLSRLPPHAHPARGLGPVVVVFGVLANVFYLLGPTAEIAIQKAWGNKLLPAGPMLYRMGLTFSVGLASLPSLIACLDWGFRILQTIF